MIVTMIVKSQSIIRLPATLFGTIFVINTSLKRYLNLTYPTLTRDVTYQSIYALEAARLGHHGQFGEA